MCAFTRQHHNGGGHPFGHVDGEGIGSGWSWCRCGRLMHQGMEDLSESSVVWRQRQ
jgi:hypothetical protein